MKSRWQLDTDYLADCSLFSTEPVMRECPYCRETFKPRWNPPTPNQTFGHWQRFCSRTCWKLWNEEHRSNARSQALRGKDD